MFLDVGVGILLGLWLGPSTSSSTNVELGILFSLLPDADVLIYFFFKWTKLFNLQSKLRSHRELFHFPLPYLLFGSLPLLVVYPNLVPLFLVASVIHYIHDSFGIGWGMPLFHPLSKKYYKFVYQYDLYQAKVPQQLMWRWSKQEQNELIDKYRDPEWARHNYYKFTKATTIWRSIEFTVFLVALIVLLQH